MSDFQRCLNCFEELSGHNQCHKCKWDKTKRDVGLHLEPGQKLNNRYVLGRVLGQGGFGITYLGWDTKLETKVAVKEYLHTRYASRKAGTTVVTAHGNSRQEFENGVDRFLAEARVLALFNTHPNIVTVIDHFEANGTGYFVMQFVPGMTMKEMLQQYGRLGWWDAVKIFLQIAEGLRAVHSRKLIHFDLSPDNIYLETTPQRERIIKALLMDFGNSHNYGSGKLQGRTPILKDGFAPPEQYSDHAELGPWTDVYALGATLYMALTGKEPISSIERVATDTLPSTRESIPTAPTELADLLDSTLALKPEKRPGLDKVCNVLGELLHKKPRWWELLLYQIQQQLGLILALCGSAIMAATAIIMTNTPYTDGELDAIISKSCEMADVSPARQGWYAMVEFGASGIKPVAVKFEGLTPKEFKELKIADVTPYEPQSLPKVVERACETIKKLHGEYGDLPIYFVASSGIDTAPHLPDMRRWLYKATRKNIESVTAVQEMRYLSKGTWRDLPSDRLCRSALVDIGSGNIKGGYVRECESEQTAGELNFEAFNIDKFGTKAFTKKVFEPDFGYVDQLFLWLKNWWNGTESNSNIDFVQTSNSVGHQLETMLSMHVRSNPEITSNKDRVYLVGGAVWAINRLMCLDCPQYDGRSNAKDQAKYTVIKPSDIDEFYRYVTSTDGKQICAPFDYPNPYLNRNMDTNTSFALTEERLKFQNDEITKVCSKFSASKANNSFLSMAVILRTLVNTLEIDEGRRLFFLQNQQYTWPQEFLIEKIQAGGN